MAALLALLRASVTQALGLDTEDRAAPKRRELAGHVAAAATLAPHARRAFIRKYCEPRSNEPRLVRRLENINTPVALGATDFEQIWLEFLRFLALHRYVARDETLGPPPSVDLAWHVALLHTREYAELCAHLCGRFVDHFPERALEVHPAIRRHERYARTHKLYELYVVGSAALGTAPGTAPGTAVGSTPSAPNWPAPRNPLDFGSRHGGEC
jgi:hypothetical protein